MRFKQLTSVLMGMVLVFGMLPGPAFASDSDDDQKGKYDTKDEAIYGNLDLKGSLNDIYVVNTFHVKKTGNIADHGDYTDVRNLTDLTDMEQDGNKVRFQAKKEDADFNYQGFLKKQPLPWNIDVTYLLDGDVVDPDDLAGKNGSLEIQIETSANEDVDKTFFEYYMLQISLTLDPEVFEDIQAPDATKAKEGKNTNLTFTVMPEEEEDFIVSANVSDLEMDPIDINATPANMPIDDPDLGDMKDDIQSLADAIEDVDGGVGGLRDGISDLNDGATELRSGSTEYQNGINELDESSGELVNGSAQIRDTLNQVNNAVQGDIDIPDLGEFEEFPEHLRNLSDGLQDVADNLDNSRNDYDDAFDKLKSRIDDLPEDAISEDDIEKLLDEIEDAESEDVARELKEAYDTAKELKEEFPDIDEVFDSVEGILDDAHDSAQEMADNVAELATTIEAGMDQMDGLDSLTELQEGLSTMASEYQSFHNGLVEYTDGVGELASSYSEIDNGIDGLADGSGQLENGADDLKEGTQELRDETKDMPDEMQSEVDEMLDEFDMSDFEPVSFVSDKNKDVDVVQFILQTESIEIDEPEKKDDDEEEEKSIWERFLDLFR